MKVAITTAEARLDSPVDPRFSAAPYVLLVNLEKMDCTVYENPAARPGMGHGIVAARFVAALGADAVISGSYCPHGFGALTALGKDLYDAREGTAAELLVQLEKNALDPAQPSPHHHHAAHVPPGRSVPVAG